MRIQSEGRKLAAAAGRTVRKSGLVSLVVLAGALGLGTTQPALGQDGRLNIQQIGDALTSYGKNTVTQNGQTYYTVNCGNGNWRGNVVVSLSPDNSVIWMTIDPTPMPDGRASATALANLMKKNQEIGPMFFSINGRRLRLSYPVPNHDLNTARVKAYLEAVVNTAVDTMPLWDPSSLGGN